MCIGCTSTCKDGSGERFRLPAADDEVRERVDVGRRGEVREALGEVDGADALRQVGQLLDGRRPGPPRRRRQPPLHGVAPRARAPAWQRGGRSDKVRSGSAQLS